MSSLYKFDSKLKSIYPDLKSYIDSKVVQQLMEEIIYEEPSLNFIKSYLEDKGYIYIDKRPEELDNIIKRNKKLDNDKKDNYRGANSDEEYKEETYIKEGEQTNNIDSEEIEDASIKTEDEFDFDAFMESNEFKAGMKSADKVVGYKNNKDLFDDYAICNSQEVRNNLLVNNLPLVRKIASKYNNASTGSLVYEDLVSEGVLGLMKAIDRFKKEYGYEFSTYAYYWIKQSITRAIADKALNVRLPVHLHETLNKINKFEREFWKQGGEPEVEKIAKLCDLSVEKYYELKIVEASFRKQTSLNTPLKEDSQEDILMMLEQKSSLWFTGGLDEFDPVQVSNYHALKNELEILLKYLTEREEQVIRLRYGVDGNEPKTLEEIGDMMNVTRERIRQIQAKAIVKLRKKSAGVDLPLFLVN